MSRRQPANDPTPNPLLRAHVSDFGFVLTLRKTHILVLSHIASNPDKEAWTTLEAGSPTRSFWVPAVRGVIDRGLVVHRHSPDFKGLDWNACKRLTDCYRLTRAGWLAYDLLAEAGLAPAIDRTAGTRRLVA